MKLKSLQGIANNLLESVISSYDFLNILYSIKNFSDDSFDDVSINILSKHIHPTTIKNDVIENTINYYNKWFLTQIEKIGVPESVIKDIKININFSKSEDDKYQLQVLEIRIFANEKIFQSRRLIKTEIK